MCYTVHEGGKEKSLRGEVALQAQWKDVRTKLAEDASAINFGHLEIFQRFKWLLDNSQKTTLAEMVKDILKLKDSSHAKLLTASASNSGKRAKGPRAEKASAKSSVMRFFG